MLEEMKEQFPCHSEPDESFDHQADTAGKPPGGSVDRRKSIHPAERKLFDRFENEVSKENWELLIKFAAP